MVGWTVIACCEWCRRFDAKQGKRTTDSGQPCRRCLGLTRRSCRMRHEATPHEHGNSVAAWMSVAIITVGFLIGAFAFFVAAPWVFVLGIAVALVGVLAGKL